MKTTTLIPCFDSRNAGDNREWALCRAYGLPRTTHDSKPYYMASDLEIGALKISIKASAFSLMTSALCEGLTDFDAIWNLFESKTHSNTYAYVTADFTCYLMNLAEFKKFVYTFCYLDRDSVKNGGKCKIRCRKESSKMLAWLAAGC